MKITLVLSLILVLLVISGECGFGRLFKSVIGRKAFGSRKPARHFSLLPNRKAAENAARNAGKGKKNSIP